jgi:hypothetical protein
MKIHDIRLIGNTDGAGAMTETSARAVFGFIEKIVWVDGTFADGVDCVLSATNTASGIDETLWTGTDLNNDASYYPRNLIHGDSTALTGTAGGDRTKILVQGNLKLVVSSGGATKVGGGMIVYISEFD